jgi:hypothetical protein
MTTTAAAASTVVVVIVVSGLSFKKQAVVVVVVVVVVPVTIVFVVVVVVVVVGSDRSDLLSIDGSVLHFLIVEGIFSEGSNDVGVQVLGRKIGGRIFLEGR